MDENRRDFQMRIRFNRLNWSYVISSILLFFLPIFNFPFTSKPGEPLTIRFFLDFELLARLDTQRNVIDVITPIPMYYIIGILPGIFGLILIVYTFLFGGPKWLIIDSENIQVVETKLIFTSLSKIALKDLQTIKVGKRRRNLLLWLFFLFLSFWAIYIFMYAFDSLKNNGSLHFFSIFQDVWDGEQIIGQINLGLHLLVTALVLFLAPLLITVFSRRECYIETEEFFLDFNFSSIKIIAPDNSKGLNHPLVSTLFMNLKSFTKNKTNLMPQTIDKNNSISSTSNLMTTTYPNRHFPRLKFFFYTVSIIILILFEISPNLYLGNFTIPFINIGLLCTLFFLLTSIDTEWFSHQKLISSDSNFLIIRKNSLSGPYGYLFQNPTQFEETLTPHSPTLIEYIIVSIFLWEILVIWGTILKYNSYFLTNPITIIYLFTTLTLFITVLIFYITRTNKLSFYYAQEKPTNPSQDCNSYHSIFWPKAQNSHQLNSKTNKDKLSLSLSLSKIRKIPLNLIILFIIPLILFILWLLDVLWIHILI